YTVDRLIIEPDGKATVVGWQASNTAYIGRVLPNGNADPAFGSGASGFTSVAGDYTSSLDGALVPGGGYLLKGCAYHATVSTRIVRLDSNGQVDPAFVQSGLGDTRCLALHGTQADGRILVSATQTVNGLTTGIMGRLLP